MRLELARLAGVALVATGLPGLVVAASHRFEIPSAPPPALAARPPAIVPDSAAAGSALAAAVGKAPFRARRTPAVPYDPALVGAPPPPPGPPKPALVLAGIVWGATPLAAIEGVPGHEGAMVLGIRDSAGGIRVRRIARESVILAGHDTVWTLRIRGRE